jgi:hypothetical protein
VSLSKTHLTADCAAITTRLGLFAAERRGLVQK